MTSMYLANLIEDIPVARFDIAAGSAYGPIGAATRERRKDHLDKSIAARAVSLNVALVRDFARHPGHCGPVEFAPYP